MSDTFKFAIKSRWNDKVLFEADLDASLQTKHYSIQLGAAVKVAVKAGADLTGADLTGVYLTGANLAGADLTGADLAGAYLVGADLAGADLTGAYLTGANLVDADLAGADLTGAYLVGVYLTGADLAGADLTGADLTGAYLTGAYNADLAFARTSIVPQCGSYIGWKRCARGVIVKLSIPAEARRSNASRRKCRAEFADVLEIFGATEAKSQHDPAVVYRVGERVTCHEWDENRWNECSGGIHHFITRIEAENY